MSYLALLGLLTIGGIGYIGWRRLGSRPAAWWVLIGISTSVALVLRPAFTAYELRALQRDLPQYADLPPAMVRFNLTYSRASFPAYPRCYEMAVAFAKQQGSWTRLPDPPPPRIRPCSEGMTGDEWR